MNAQELTAQLPQLIAAASSPMEKIETIVASLSKVFAVEPDEVALFSFDQSREVLVFVWPLSLKSVGSIPLNAHRCLVSKTAVDRTAGLDNSFASTPHLYMFEHFISAKDKRLPIQKIMSVPAMHDGQLRGVIQIARKGVDRESSGGDFSAVDLASLSSVASCIAAYL
jgi:hypothetical protein